MINKILLALSLFISSAICAQRYTAQNTGSKVHFVIKNFGIKTGGDLSGLKGEILFFANDMSACHFTVTADPATIDTDNETRDSHLKKDEYFDVARYPAITITSTKIDKTNKTDQGYYFFTGTLTIKDSSKPISFSFHVQKVNDDFLFTGDFQINRLDFGVGSSSAVLGNAVNVSLSILAKKS